MQSNNNPFSGFQVFEDLTKMATGTVGTIFDAKKEAEHMVKHNVEQLLGLYNLVTREEFEVVKEMAATAREEQVLLEKRVQELEAKLAATTKPAAQATSKPEAKKPAAKKAAKPKAVSKKTEAKK